MALGRSAHQSSTFLEFNASQAVDGGASDQFDRNSCSTTKQEKSPWWSVDLGIQRHVVDIRIKSVLKSKMYFDVHTTMEIT